MHLRKSMETSLCKDIGNNIYREFITIVLQIIILIKNASYLTGRKRFYYVLKYCMKRLQYLICRKVSAISVKQHAAVSTGIVRGCKAFSGILVRHNGLFHIGHGI